MYTKLLNYISVFRVSRIHLGAEISRARQHVENVLKQNCHTLRRLAKWNNAISEWNRELQAICPQDSIASLTLPTTYVGMPHEEVTSRKVQKSSHRNKLPTNSHFPVRSDGGNNNDIDATSSGNQGEPCSTSLREWLPTTNIE